MSSRLIPEHDLGKFVTKAEQLFAHDDPILFSSLDGRPYIAEAMRYILLTQYPHIMNDLLSFYSSDDLFYTRFFWHNVARGVIQSIEPDSLLFVGDMDDVLGSPSGFFQQDELDEMYEQAERYISSWVSRNRNQ